MPLNVSEPHQRHRCPLSRVLGTSGTLAAFSGAASVGTTTPHDHLIDESSYFSQRPGPTRADGVVAVSDGAGAGRQGLPPRKVASGPRCRALKFTFPFFSVDSAKIPRALERASFSLDERRFRKTYNLADYRGIPFES